MARRQAIADREHRPTGLGRQFGEQAPVSPRRAHRERAPVNVENRWTICIYARGNDPIASHAIAGEAGIDLFDPYSAPRPGSEEGCPKHPIQDREPALISRKYLRQRAKQSACRRRDEIARQAWIAMRRN